jgi:ribonuclease HII
MGIITAVRSQVPVPAPVSQPAQVAASRASAPVAETMLPVAETVRKDAVRQTDTTVAAAKMQLGNADGNSHPVAAARVAAEAARDAYIRASIAAGVNPLPLP